MLQASRCHCCLPAVFQDHMMREGLGPMDQIWDPPLCRSWLCRSHPHVFPTFHTCRRSSARTHTHTQLTDTQFFHRAHFDQPSPIHTILDPCPPSCGGHLLAKSAPCACVSVCDIADLRSNQFISLALSFLLLFCMHLSRHHGSLLEHLCWAYVQQAVLCHLRQHRLVLSLPVGTSFSTLVQAQWLDLGIITIIANIIQRGGRWFHQISLGFNTTTSRYSYHVNKQCRAAVGDVHTHGRWSQWTMQAKHAFVYLPHFYVFFLGRTGA